MKMIKHIWFILVVLWIMPGVSAQYINIVCTGDSGVVYKVQGTAGSTFQWEVDGGTIVSDYGDSISVKWGNKKGEYTVSVQEFSIHGCPAIPVTGTVLVSSPDIELGEDIELCENESIEINPKGTFYSYLWQDGSTNDFYRADSEGYISLEVTDEYGCRQKDSLYLTIHPLPVVDLGRDTSLCGTETLLLNAGTDGSFYQWSTGETYNEITVYEGKQTIWVEVIDENNCVTYDTMTIFACSTEDYFKDMPTAFTPNGDGQNDVWRIPELEAFPLAVVEVYDRWGNLLFRSEPGYSDPWDGISNDGREMPMDSYYFVIDIGEDDLQPVVGSVTIIK